MTEQNKPSILLIEDDEELLHLVSRALRRTGFRVEGYSNAEAGLNAIATTSFNAVLTDLNLPGMNGIDFIVRIQRRAANQHIAIFAMTGFPDNEITQRLHALKTSKIFLKPFDLKDVSEHILHAVEQEAQRTKHTPQSKIYECFFNAASETLKLYAHQQFSFGKAEATHFSEFRGELTATSAFFGCELSGFCSLVLSQTLADQLEDGMFGGRRDTDIDRSTLGDYIGEISLQMIDLAQVHLASYDLVINKGFSSVTLGGGHSLVQRCLMPIIRAPVLASGKEVGQFAISIAMNNHEKSNQNKGDLSWNSI
jgi:two-component system chemotaxis response regulator CheY